MEKMLYLTWQDPKTRSWFPIGRLTWDGSVYRFVYTKGTEKSPNFLPIGRMKDLYAVYESHELFPTFMNRLLPRTRPEYKHFLQWLNIKEGEDHPFVLLALTGGMRETDSLLVFPCPQPRPDNTYHMNFFSHGVRHLPVHSVAVIEKLSPGERLYLMPDPQNPHDALAIALRTGDPVTIVGYCPRYLTGDFHVLLKENKPEEVEVFVERVNVDAPIHLRLLCSLISPWPASFRPCSSEEYVPLAE